MSKMAGSSKVPLSLQPPPTDFPISLALACIGGLSLVSLPNKGVRFQGLRDAGDPVELALAYQDQGADEIVFLDISATGQLVESL